MIEEVRQLTRRWILSSGSVHRVIIVRITVVYMQCSSSSQCSHFLLSGGDAAAQASELCQNGSKPENSSGGVTCTCSTRSSPQSDVLLSIVPNSSSPFFWPFGISLQETLWPDLFYRRDLYHTDTTDPYPNHHQSACDS